MDILFFNIFILEHTEKHKSQITFLPRVFAHFMCLHISTPQKHISQIMFSYICLLCSGHGTHRTTFLFSLTPPLFCLTARKNIFRHTSV